MFRGLTSHKAHSENSKETDRFDLTHDGIHTDIFILCSRWNIKTLL